MAIFEGEFSWDRESGNGIIAGSGGEYIVTVANSPAAREVILINKASRQVVRRLFSASDGTFEFSQLKETNRYIVLATDHADVYNAAVADNIQPYVAP